MILSNRHTAHLEADLKSFLAARTLPFMLAPSPDIEGVQIIQLGLSRAQQEQEANAGEKPAKLPRLGQ